MKKYLFALILSASFCLACSSKKPLLCEPSTTQVCTCLNQAQGTRKCSNDGMLWERCQCESIPPIKEHSIPFEETTAQEQHITTHEKTAIPEERRSETHHPQPTSDAGEEHKEKTREEVPTEVTAPSCQEGETKDCFTGRSGCTKDQSGNFQCQGSCKVGERTCRNGSWSSCESEVTPGLEVKDGKDNNCDGHIDNIFTQVSAGDNHTCALLSNGEVKCWGNNYYHQLGNDPATVSSNSTPTLVKGVTQVKAISSRDSVACVLLNNGTVKCWGFNGLEQLGFPSKKLNGSAGPTEISNLTNVKQVSVGGTFVCALLHDGTVKCWGSNSYGQLGNGTTSKTSRVMVQVSNLKDAKQISTGSSHVCALLNDKTVKCWGKNDSGQLGDGTTTSKSLPTDVSKLGKVIHVSAGKNHTCALLEDKSVECWGNNTQGKLGIEPHLTQSLEPQAIKQVSNAKQIFAGEDGTCGLLNNGTVICWGKNDKGQLGDGTTISRFEPKLIKNLSNIAQISMGEEHVCALQKNGVIVCWGSNKSGKRGLPKEQVLPLVQKEMENSKQISISEKHLCALTSGKTIKCWGKNDKGQLGDSPSLNSDKPLLADGLQQVTQVSSRNDRTCAVLKKGQVKCWGHTGTSFHLKVKDAKQVAVGENHTCVLLKSGTVQCWGDNRNGQLGNETKTKQDEFVQVKHLHNIKQISAGRNHTCALDEHGNAWCWGWNNSGQLGDGTTLSKFEPTQVKNLNKIKELNAGYDHTCALLNNGTIQCWGANSSGQLGDGLRVNQTKPVKPIQSLTDIRQVAASRHHTCVLFGNGMIKCWGYNGNGQLGDGTSTQRKTPTLVLNISNAKQISTGESHTCALLKDETVKCWGNNSTLQLGHREAITTYEPGNAIKHLANVKSVSSGRLHTCALLDDETVKCWGSNKHGQLGVPTNQYKQKPTSLTFEETVKQVSTGLEHTCVLFTNGTVKCWGENEHKQLGNPFPFEQGTPIPLQGLSSAKQITAGLQHTCALLDNDTVHCWGNNGYAKLVGHPGKKEKPAQVQNISDVKQVAAGLGFTCVLLNDGTVKCWGNNSLGLLGDGTKKSLFGQTPFVKNLTGVRQISIHWEHACALLNNGNVKCWGNNEYGQLGDGTTTEKLGPVQIQGISHVKQIAAGKYHTCALLNNGNVKCWGKNDKGQLGQKITKDVSPPNTVSNLHGVKKIFVGGNVTCAQLSNDAIKCWGDNTYGHLNHSNETGMAFSVQH